MDKKPMGKKAEPTQDELEFIHSRIDRMSDRAILSEMQDESFTVRSVGFINRRRKEFLIAKRVLKAQLEKEIDPIMIERKRQHIKDLTKVAQTLLSGGLSGIKLTKDGRYEYDRANDEQYPGGVVPITTNREEGIEPLVKQLHINIEKAYDKHRNYDLFEYFLVHLTSSIPGFPNPDKADLHKLADASPLKLIAALKMLALKKDFKGKCPVCKGCE